MYSACRAGVRRGNSVDAGNFWGRGWLDFVESDALQLTKKSVRLAALAKTSRTKLTSDLSELLGPKSLVWVHTFADASNGCAVTSIGEFHGETLVGTTVSKNGHLRAIQ
jgi:hypothetical protein